MMKKMLITLFAMALVLFSAAVYAMYRSEQAALRQAAQSVPQKADVALVLGNAVNRRGKPNPCLKSRVETGVWLYRAGLAGKLLMSGGTDGDGANEAETMRDMAVNLGMPSENIIIENQSESTYENIAFSAPLLADTADVIIVSDGFHLARARWLAARHWQGKTVQTFASGSCGDSGLNHGRKLLREVLAWGKALVLHR
ncbi:YdcF family protein [Neisseria perflava]|uniref:YdcF family protein n=1 Tax=Neisseria perflava TaxID=33053 RepID=UPI00209E8359|nr:YdcF family protein [Neisseria perflava]MCP1660849.1 vancomycin permeability regulator SanA [Neisseria perflava]MCP1772508.1 vancomycin permeability regulator SanA [Neisseria perflava]